MKTYIIILLCLIGAISADAQITSGTLAFPGAEGYGKYTTGGRGGEVCYVTRLDDCSDSNLVPGTLRWALYHDNGGKPRTILFNVSGTIYLTSKLRFKYPNVSILGQSAPGGGICLSGFNMYVNNHNVIIRYIRFRAGDIPSSSMTGLDVENAQNVILDHCSLTWSMEECLTAYDTKYTTVQWCIIGEGLYNSKNAKGARAYAMQWGGEHSSMLHTLVTNSHSRSPRFNGARDAGNGHDTYVDSEFANNVVFNWSQTGSIYGGEMKSGVDGYNRVYMINNYYRPGPSTKQNKAATHFVSPSVDNNKGAGYGQFYLNGNKFEETGTYTPWTAADAQNKNANNNLAANALPTANLLSGMPQELASKTYDTPEATFAKVTTQAGASLPRYDEVDKRLLAEAAGKRAPKFTGTINELGIIDSPDDIVLDDPGVYYVNGKAYLNYPNLGMKAGDKYVVDSDCDGLPDAYETKVGMNPNDAADAAVVGADGYTALEKYMNGIADGTILKARYETSAFPTNPNAAAPAQVTVSFSAGAEAQTVAYGTPVTLPTVNGDVTYSMWTGNGLCYEAGKAYVFPENITLSPMVTLTYDFNGLQPVIVSPGKAVVLPAVEREGANFLGWSDGATTYAAGATYAIKNTVTLTPLFQNTGKVEKAIYTTDFQDWAEAATSTTETSKSVTTDITNETLTFKYLDIDIKPAGTNAKFTGACVTLGYLMSAKAANTYIETSELKNISTISFVQAATGGSRGWGVKVKGDGDADWVTVFDTFINPAAGQEVNLTINRNNCKILFYNLTSSNTDPKNYQNAYMTGLTIRAMIEGATPDTPTDDDKPEDPGNIFEDCAPFDAQVYNAAGLKLALADAKTKSANQRYRIFLHDGVYDFGTAAKNVVPQNTSLIGESQEGVLVKNNPGTVTNYQDQTPVFFIDQNQNNVYMQDLTIRQARDWDAKKSQGQALAVRQRGKKAIYKNVTMQGVQDTYYLNKSDAQAYFENCTMAGEVDFIYGDGTMWFEKCNLHPVSANAVITAPNTPAGVKGIVFNECTIENEPGCNAAGYALGRPWNESPASTYINTTMKVLPSAAGWKNMTNNLVVRFHEYGSKDADGNALDLSSRSIAACNAAASSDAPVLTADQAAAYTIENILPGWTPKNDTKQLVAENVTSDGFVMTWPAVEGAFCYAIVKDGKVVAFTSETSFIANASAGVYGVRVANEMGGLGQLTVATVTDAIRNIAASQNSKAPMYNLAGQRITTPRRGQVYIQNGVKRVFE